MNVVCLLLIIFNALGVLAEEHVKCVSVFLRLSMVLRLDPCSDVKDQCGWQSWWYVC